MGPKPDDYCFFDRGPSKNDEKKLTEARGWLSNRRSNDLDIEFRAKPVPGQSEMTYLVPRAPLLPGAYEVLKDGAMVGFFTVQDEKLGDPVDHADFCVDRIRWVNLGGPGFEYVPCNENFGRNVVSTAQGEQSAGRLREHLDRSPPASDEPREQFRDQKLGFGFSYPATFELQPRNVRPSLIGLTPPNAGVEGTTKAMIFVEVGKTPLLDPNPSVSGIIERQIAATVGNLTGSVVTGPMETTIAGQKAQVFFSSGTRDGHSEEQAITIGVGHKRWMKVNLVVQGGSLDQYLDEYRRVCDSMELF